MLFPSSDKPDSQMELASLSEGICTDGMCSSTWWVYGSSPLCLFLFSRPLWMHCMLVLLLLSCLSPFLVLEGTWS